jgi:hypothetical protein
VSTYRATVRVEGGMLHTARPLTAPEEVSDLVDSVVYNVQSAGGGALTSVEVTVETSTDSGTPLGDSIAGTSSQPLPAADVDPDDGTPYLTEPASLADDDGEDVDLTGQTPHLAASTSPAGRQ